MTTEIELQNDEYEDLEQTDDFEDELFAPYKSISKAAVVSLLFALFSLTGLLFPVLLSATAFGILFGILALRSLRRYPDELTGRSAAYLGLFGSVLLLGGGSIMHTYIYMTEVPDGYQRISYAELQPGEGLTEYGGPVLPTYLDSKRVFVKGYIHPGVSDMGEIRKFVLVPDMGTCCFGGQPAMSDMIEVTIVGQRGVRYAPRSASWPAFFTSRTASSR